MGYRIISRDKYQLRGERWDDIIYPSRQSAEIAVEQAKAWVKGSKYLKNSGTTFKIVKESEGSGSISSGLGFFGSLR